MYYADLTQCRDLETFAQFAGRTLLAVGWLEPGHVFPQGTPDVALAATLAKYAPAYGVGFFSGSHHCGFCVSARNGAFRGAPEGWRNLFFQVPGQDAIIVVPELIAHYIEAHGYQPPELFRDAVAWRPPLELGALPPH